MDDLASMISEFLNSEEGMSQLSAVASALGLDTPSGVPSDGEGNHGNGDEPS